MLPSSLMESLHIDQHVVEKKHQKICRNLNHKNCVNGEHSLYLEGKFTYLHPLSLTAYKVKQLLG